MRVKCLAQEHNAVPQPELEHGPLVPESSALIIRPPRLPSLSQCPHQILFPNLLLTFFLFLFLISFQIDPGNIRIVLKLVEYFSMSLSTLVLGLVSDACGRRKTLFASLLITLIAGMASAFAFKIMAVFAILRSVVGVAIGMELTILGELGTR